MTGTVGNSSAVFRGLYRLAIRGDSHAPPARREQLPDVVLRTAEEKWQAIVAEVARVHSLNPAGADRHAEHFTIGAAFRAAPRADLPHEVLGRGTWRARRR